MIEQEAFERIEAAGKELEDRKPGYAEAEAYYDGDHPLPYASVRWKRAFQFIVKKLRDNLCELVINALVARLQVAGFGVELIAEPGRVPVLTATDQPADGEQGGQAKQGRDRATAIWAYNRMDAKQVEVHEEAAKKGDSFVIVWPDANGRACIYPNEPELIHVEYNADAVVQWAVKLWEEDDRLRATIYYPDRLEKYVSASKQKQGRPESAAGWEPYEVPVVVTVPDPAYDDGRLIEVIDAEPWPLPNPYGRVPVFHFRNRGRSGGYGVSELRNIIPVQDALNKSLMDLMVTSESLGYPLRYLLGLAPERDEETGEQKDVKLDISKDAFWTAWGEQLTAGQFPAAELAPLIGQVNDHRQEIGRLSQTPPHLLFMTTGEIPSGEALKVVEAPFTAKVENRQTVWGNVWEDVIGFAILVDYQATVMLSAEWVDAQPVSELEKATRAEAWKRLGIPDRYIWRHVLGFTDQEVTAMLALRDQEAADRARNMDQAMGGRQAPPFGSPGAPPPGQGGYTPTGNGQQEGAG